MNVSMNIKRIGKSYLDGP